MPFISEIKYLGSGAIDFIEISVPTGTDPATIQLIVYNPSGTVRTTNAIGSLVATQGNKDLYVIDSASSATFNGIHQNGAAALVVNGVVTQFVSFNGPLTATAGPANGLTSTVIGTTGRGESLESTDGGATYSTQGTPSPGSVPCFVEGSLIRTQRGDVAVETLRAGDLVETINGGLAPLRWIGSRVVNVGRFQGPNYDPVLIPKDAFGPGLPFKDLQVSKSHRMMLDGPECELLFATRQVLAAAKQLEGHNDIRPVKRIGRFRYFHIAFDRHEIISVNGCPTESLHVCKETANVFSDVQISELRSVLPWQTASNQKTARLALKAYEAQLLLEYRVRKQDPEQRLAA